ncbi:MAG: PKD domain-containing protein [Cyclobacteriaceae bacterium]
MKQLKVLKTALMLTLVSGLTFVMSCKDGDDAMKKEAVASFTAAVDSEDFLKVTFTNLSQNAESYAWDFGDGTGTSTEENPVYTYSAEGTFVVTLVATSADETTDDFTLSVTIKDPAAAIRDLVGDGNTGKVWQLLADVSGGNYPYQVGPNDRSQIWWAFGGPNDFDELCVRDCVFDDTWTFFPDETFTFENNDTFWGEGGVWREDLVGCFDASDPNNFVGPNDEDLSDWDSGSHGFVYDPSAETITIDGGFLGLSKLGTTAEVKVPQSSVTYDVIKLVNDDVDTLILETSLAEAGGYWRTILVSYDNVSDKVVVDACAVDANFTYTNNATEVTFTNTSNDAAINFSWDFGDESGTSTDENPVYTYGSLGTYNVTLTTDDGAGNTATVTKEVVVANPITSFHWDFETTQPTWSLFGGTDFNAGGMSYSYPANPVSGGINTSGTVVQLDEPDGSQGWSGMSTVLEGKIDFTSSQTIKIKVYSPFAGAVVKLKFEENGNGDNNKEIDLTTTSANTWEELTYTFETGDSNKWDVFVLFFDFQANAKTGARTHYFDDISFGPQD